MQRVQRKPASNKAVVQKNNTIKQTKRKISTKNNKKVTKKAQNNNGKRQFSTDSMAVLAEIAGRESNLIDRAMKYPVCQVDTLDSGLRVATEHLSGQLASISVAVHAGSRYETAQNNGTAHFLEHTLFKGTKKRSRTQLEMEVENMGASLNAFTSREQTVFTVTTQKRDIAQGIEILSDMVLNSKITEAAVEAERRTIIEEYESVMFDLQEACYDELHRGAFKGSNLAFDILGPPENIASITAADIHTYVGTHYLAPRMAIVATGDVDHGEVTELVKKNFAKLPLQSPTGLLPNIGPKATWNSSFRHLDDTDLRERPLSSLAIAFNTPGHNHHDHYAMMAAQMLLNNLTDTLDTVGNAAPFNTQYSDSSLFGLYLEAAPDHMGDHARDVIRTFAETLSGASQETHRAKDNLASALLSQYEGCEMINLEVSRQILAHGRRIHPREAIARVSNVTNEAIARVIKDWIQFPNVTAALVGEMGDCPDLNEIKQIGMENLKF